MNSDIEEIRDQIAEVIAEIRDQIADATNSSDMYEVARALDFGRRKFPDAPGSILELWDADSELYAVQDREIGPFTQEEVARLIRNLSRGWQGVAAIVVGSQS